MSVKTNYTLKIIINLKNKPWTAIKIAPLDENNLFIIMSPSHAGIRKIPVHDHMTHMVKVDILTGHEGIINLHFVLKFIFYCIFIAKSCIFSNLIQLTVKV